VNYENTARSTARGTVRTLSRQEELPLLRDHLLRLDRESRHDRFHGFMDDGFIERYAAKCAEDGTIIIAYLENGVVRGAAELHPPDRSPDSQPEIAFSVEAQVRRQGVGNKFGAHLTFRHGESTGSIDLKQQAQPEPARLAIATPFDATRAMVNFNREYWKFLLRMSGWGRTA